MALDISEMIKSEFDEGGGGLFVVVVVEGKSIVDVHPPIKIKTNKYKRIFFFIYQLF